MRTPRHKINKLLINTYNTSTTAVHNNYTVVHVPINVQLATYRYTIRDILLITAQVSTILEEHVRVAITVLIHSTSLTISNEVGEETLQRKRVEGDDLYNLVLFCSLYLKGASANITRTATSGGSRKQKKGGAKLSSMEREELNPRENVRVTPTSGSVKLAHSQPGKFHLILA